MKTKGVQMKSFCFLVLFATLNRVDASGTQSKWAASTKKLTSLKGGGLNDECCCMKPSAALKLSAVAAGAIAIQSCFPESFSDMHTSLDDFVDSPSGKFWKRWFSIGLFQQTALTAVAAMSKDEESKKAFCLVSALNWASSAAGLFLTRDDMKTDMQPIDLAVHIGMSATMLAGAGAFNWGANKVKDASSKVKGVAKSKM